MLHPRVCTYVCACVRVLSGPGVWCSSSSHTCDGIFSLFRASPQSLRQGSRFSQRAKGAAASPTKSSRHVMLQAHERFGELCGIHRLALTRLFVAPWFLQRATGQMEQIEEPVLHSATAATRHRTASNSLQEHAPCELTTACHCSAPPSTSTHIRQQQPPIALAADTIALVPSLCAFACVN